RRRPGRSRSRTRRPSSGGPRRAALFLIAAAAPDGRVRRWAAAGSGVLALGLLPSGYPPDGMQLTLAVGGGALALLALWWMFEMSAPSGVPSRTRTVS
ncbi:hypothetical protein AB0H70_36760, partial [Streptomyces sp. NPDC050804]